MPAVKRGAEEQAELDDLDYIILSSKEKQWMNGSGYTKEPGDAQRFKRPAALAMFVESCNTMGSTEYMLPIRVSDIVLAMLDVQVE